MWIQVISNTNYCNSFICYYFLPITSYLYTHSLYYLLLITSYLISISNFFCFLVLQNRTTYVIYIEHQK